MGLTEEEKALYEQYYEECLKDIHFFAQEFLPNLLTFEVPPFHKEMYKLLMGNKRLVMAAPRGFAKSTISSVIYPIWIACMDMGIKDVCIISASEGLAVEMMRRVKREIEANERIREFFGDLRTDKWSETHFITRTGINFRARGAGGQIRGFRPDCLILDDIETDELVESEEQRRKLKEWLFKACLNTLLPHGQFVMIGSILHPLSILNDLLLTDQGWEKRKYQAYKDAKQEPGQELWPQLWPHEKLQERKREIGSFAFSSEYLNDPISNEAAPIKESMIRNWTRLPEQLTLVIAVDPAYTEEEKGDYKVASLIGTDERLNRYLVSYVRTHTPTKEFLDAILNMWMQERNRITAIGIPNSGVEKQFFKSFLDYAQSRNLYPPVVELSNSFISATGKSVRSKKQRIIASLQPLFEAGKYYIHPEHTDAREELLNIGGSRWDDLVDTMAYAEQIITPSLNTGFNSPSMFLDGGDDERGRYGILTEQEKAERQLNNNNYGMW